MAMSGPMEWKARAYLSSLTQMRITAGHDSLHTEKKQQWRMGFRINSGQRLLTIFGDNSVNHEAFKVVSTLLSIVPVFQYDRPHPVCV